MAEIKTQRHWFNNYFRDRIVITKKSLYKTLLKQ